MNCCCGKNEIDINEVKQNNICMRCNDNIVTNHVREFDYKKLPKEYFHEPNYYVVAILKRQNIDPYPDYWIQLPPDLLLTRYRYRVCTLCYNQIKNDKLHPWNEWREI